MQEGRFLALGRPGDYPQRVGRSSLRVHPFAIGRTKELGNFGLEELCWPRRKQASEREILATRQRPSRRGLHDATPIAIEFGAFDAGHGENTLGARGLVALTGERLDDLSEQQVAHVRVFEVTAGLAHERGL